MTIETLSLVLTSVLLSCCATDLSKVKGFDIEMATEKTTQPYQGRKDFTAGQYDFTDQRGWAPEVTVHILNVLEQVHNRLAGWEVKLSGFETQLATLKDEMSTMKKDLNDNIVKVGGSLKSEIDTVSSSINKEIATIKENVNDDTGIKEINSYMTLVEQRLQEELRSLKENVIEKLGTIEDNEKELRSQVLAVEQRQAIVMSTEVDNLENRLKLFLTQREDNSGVDLTKTKQVVPLQDVYSASIRKELVEFSNTIVSNVTDGLSRLRETIDCDVSDIVTTRNTSVASIVKDDVRLEKLAKSVEKQIYNYTTEFYKQVKSDLTIVEEEFRESLINQSATLQKMISSNGKRQNLKSVLKEVINPETCEKGMLALPNSIIYPSESSVVSVPYVCDTQTDGGGWVVFHRRVTGTVSFYRNWAEYRHGFGNLYGDFWLGLEAIHNLTSSGTFELRVDLRYAGKSAYAHYTNFGVASEGEKYVLQLGGFTGTAGDGLSVYRWMPFSTYDQDNDKYSGGSLASNSHWYGAWWWSDGGTYKSNLNALWGKTNTATSNYWNAFSSFNSVTFSEMKVRLVDSN